MVVGMLQTDITDLFVLGHGKNVLLSAHFGSFMIRVSFVLPHLDTEWSERAVHAQGRCACSRICRAQVAGPGSALMMKRLQNGCHMRPQLLRQQRMQQSQLWHGRQTWPNVGQRRRHNTWSGMRGGNSTQRLQKQDACADMQAFLM